MAFKHLPVRSFAHYVSDYPSYHFPRGASLYTQDDQGDRIFFVRRGIAKLFATSEHGDERTFRLVYPGSHVGAPAVLSGNRYGCGCTIIADAYVSWMTRQQMLHLLESEPDFSLLLLDMLAQQLVSRAQMTFRETFLTVEAQVAAVLFDLISSNPNTALAEGGYQLNVTHQEIANLVGIGRVSVTNALHAMARSKNIILKRNQIVVLDPSTLKECLI